MLTAVVTRLYQLTGILAICHAAAAVAVAEQ